VRFAAIAGWADSGTFPVSFMCTQRGVSRSGYYAWRAAEPSQREKDDSALIAVMRMLFEQARGNPGVRRTRAGRRG
jgi:putative transposase